MDSIKKGLEYLKEEGWCDFIDRRWENRISQELRNIEDITEDEIKRILDIVLW